jgi:hypothetical protein
MKSRPWSVVVVSCLLIAAGFIGLVFHFADFRNMHSMGSDVILVTFVRLLAVLTGAYMLAARNWARWLAMAWIGFHVVVSAFHPLRELAMHIVVFAVFAAALFHRGATQYFSSLKQPAR